MNRIAKLFLTAAVAVTGLSGCAVYDGYGYYEDDYYDSYDSYDRQAYYSGSRYDTSYRYSSYAPDYVYWSDYYSVLWPTYRNYYDPVFSPHFYYGVTWFPVSYFGIHYSRYQWPYYHAYAPSRYSYWDNYYDWRWQQNVSRRNRLDGRYNNYDQGDYHRYGSARNESERIAAYTGMSRYRGMASPGVQVQPYDQTHVFGWRNEGVQGHYPNQGQSLAGPQPFFRNTRGVDPLDWRSAQGNNRYNQIGEPDNGYGTYRQPNGAGSEASRIQRQTMGDRSGQQTYSDPRFQGTGREYDSSSRNNWREPGSRESGWVGEAPSLPQRRFADPVERTQPEPMRPQRESWGTRDAQPSMRTPDPSPRFETPEPREFNRPSRYERAPEPQSSYRYQAPQRESRSETSRFEMPQRSEPRYEAPQRFEAPERSQPRYEAPQRFEQPQRFEAPQRSEPPRFERQERSEPRFEAPSRDDNDGGSARESMRIMRGSDEQ